MTKKDEDTVPLESSSPEAADDDPVLTMIEAPDASTIGRHWRVKGKTSIGRSEVAGMEPGLDDPSVSRLHATIEKTPVGWKITDHDSRNGTFVDGKQVTTSRLELGSVVRVGKCLLDFGLAPALDRADSELVGHSALLWAALDRLDQVASTDMPVLILGETGTGKELASRRVHKKSERKSGVFVAVNCAAIPAELTESHLFGHKKGAFTGANADHPGCFADAKGGTLFLDEVGELPVAVQPKLLRVLENGEYTPVGGNMLQRTDVKVVAATNVDLDAKINQGVFRRDLYARLAGGVVVLPALRRRRGDILQLAKHFLKHFAPDQALTLSDTFIDRLLAYDWPMNIRELRSVMQNVVLVAAGSSLIKREHLDNLLAEEHIATKNEEKTQAPPAAERRPRPSREELFAICEQHRGNIAHIAQHFGRARVQIYRWLKQDGLDLATFRVDAGEQTAPIDMSSADDDLT